MRKERGSNKRWRRGAGSMGLAMALVGCDYFTEVTVPASDALSPTAWAAVYRAEEYEAISGGTQAALSFRVADPSLYYLVIAAGTDGGGTKKVTMNHEFTRTCVQGGLGQNTSGLLVPFVETQSGSVGSTVSNGVWTGPLVRLNDYATCNPGWTLSYVAYEWTATAEDFHGNTASHGWARIYWTP